MNKNMIRIISNIIQTILLFLISYWLINLNPKISNFDIIKFTKLIEIHFIIIGLSISLVTFIYSLINNFAKNNNDKNIIEGLSRFSKAINLNIKRMLGSLIIIIIVYFLKDIDIPKISVPFSISKIDLINSIRLFVFFYISLAFIDIIICTLKLYEKDIEINN
jgi:hypothetical protein